MSWFHNGGGMSRIITRPHVVNRHKCMILYLWVESIVRVILINIEALGSCLSVFNLNFVVNR